MSYIKCPVCDSEYYLEHRKFPFKDSGDSVKCNKCGKTLYSWGKGTDDYILIPAEDMKKSIELERRRAERAPICPGCRAKMIIKYGKYGVFWGCPRYPNCDETMKVRENDRDLL